jgi:1-acyl-sn-glycerol-3-phosphate acyltransferase
VLTRQSRLGTPLVFFPEGRRSTAVGVERFRKGAFVVASDADVPVVPITIRGTRRILPVGARWPQRGDIEVVVGSPIRPTGPGFEHATALQRLARGEILRHCEEPDLDHVSR